MFLKLTCLLLLIIVVSGYRQPDHIPDIFSRWRQRGISSDMILCCGSLIIGNATSQWETPINFKRISHVQVRNGSVRVVPFNPNATFHKNRLGSGSLSRMHSIKLGIAASIKFAADNLNSSHFPDFHALLVSSDDAKFIRPKNSSCVCNNKTYAWPPIFAQNREYVEGNVLVTVPDFSFFTDFKYQGSHGSKEDIWFNVMRYEEENRFGYNSTYCPRKIQSKPFDELVWRGTVQKRHWRTARAAVRKCNITGIMNADGEYMSRAQMCSQYQMILTLPGNGVWSWATKFNLVTCNWLCSELRITFLNCKHLTLTCNCLCSLQLCNSVTILVSPDELNGESWETREALGLRLNRHYIGVTANASALCDDLIQKVSCELVGVESFVRNALVCWLKVLWVREHPKLARQIAENGRKLALGEKQKAILCYECFVGGYEILFPF